MGVDQYDDYLYLRLKKKSINIFLEQCSVDMSSKTSSNIRKQHADNILLDLISSIHLPQDLALKITSSLKQPFFDIKNSLQQSIKQMFTPYYQRENRQLVCRKEFPPGRRKDDGTVIRHSVYTCQNCSLEDNSVFCSQCFDLSKHQGHQYQIKEFVSAFCDCGDHTKWSKDGFCERHSLGKDFKTEKKITKDLKQLIIGLFDILCLYREKYLQAQQNQNSEITQSTISEMKIITDDFGQILLEELIIINTNSLTINKITCSTLHDKVIFMDSLKYSAKYLIGVKNNIVPLKKMLLSFYQLPKTAKKCVNLIPLLIFSDDKLMQEVIIDFIKSYSSFPAYVLSPYRMLSPQLLCKSSMFHKLIKSGRILLFAPNLTNQWPDNHKEMKIRAKKIQISLIRFNTDSKYIIRLRPKCAIKYWIYSYKTKEGLKAMSSHASIFTLPLSAKAIQVMEILNKQFYSLETLSLTRHIQILGLLEKQYLVLTSVLSILFNHIFQAPERGANNLLNTEERMWAAAAYLFMLNIKNQPSFNGSEQKEYDPINDNQIQQLYKAIGVKTMQEAKKMVRCLFKKLLQYFVKADRLLYEEEYQFKWKSFKNAYFDSNNLLPSLDAIYFKILLKLIRYIGAKENKQKNHKYDYLDIAKEEINTKLLQLYHQLQESLTNHLNGGFESQKRVAIKLGSIISFVQRLHQVVYSELPDLFLSCKFSNISSRKCYQKSYKEYYYNLVKSFKESTDVDVASFQEMVSDFLFKDEKVLSELISQIKEKSINRNSCANGNKLNFHLYLSLRLKLIHTPLLINPVFSSPQNKEKRFTVGANLLMQTQAFTILSNCFEILTVEYVISQKWSKFIINLVQSMWVMTSWGEDQSRFYQYFSQHYKHLIHQLLKNGTAKFLKFLPSKIRRTILSACKINYHETISKEQGSQDDDSGLDRYLTLKFQNQSNGLVPKIEKIIKKTTCDRCYNQLELQLPFYQLCFVSQTDFPDIHSIQKGQRVLVFSSCQHYYHKSCLQNNLEKNICPQCKAIFNILIPTPQFLSLKPDKVKDIINRTYEKIEKLVPKSSQNIGIRIFKSVVAYLTLLVSIKDQRMVFGHYNIYKNIYRIIKQDIDLNELDKIKFNKTIQGGSAQIKCSVSTSIVYHIFNALAVDIAPNLSLDINQEISSQTESLLSSFFYDLKCNKDEFIDPIAREEWLRLIQIQNKLVKLENQHQGVCRYCNTRKNAFILCLLHKQNEPVIKFCLQCRQESIKKHIEKKHSGQTICLRTDNRQIYYLLLHGEDIRIIKDASINTNSLYNKFKSGKVLDKGSFCLKEENYQKVACDYYTKEFLIYSKYAAS